MKKIIFGFLLFSFLFYSENGISQSNIKIGDNAPEIFINQWIKNTPSKKSLKNKFIVLDFWATWCQPCLAAVPHINNLKKEFSDHNVIFLSMTSESQKTAKRVFNRVDFETPVVTDNNNQTHINFGDGIKGLSYYPMTVLIDDNNIIRWYGSSKNLTKEMMNDFFNKKNIQVPQLSQNGPLHKKQDPELLLKRKFSMELWTDLFMDPNTTRSIYIEQAQDSCETKEKGISIGENGAFHQNTTLHELFRNLFPTQKFVIPDNIVDMKFNFYYVDKELDSNSENLLLNEISDQLDINIETSTEIDVFLSVKVSDNSLLIKSTEKDLVKITKDNDGNMVFGKNSIEELVGLLTARTNFFWTYKGKDISKYYYSSDMTSIKSIKSSLKCYGIEVIEVPTKTEMHYISVRN